MTTRDFSSTPLPSTPETLWWRLWRESAIKRHVIFAIVASGLHITGLCLDCVAASNYRLGLIFLLIVIDFFLNCDWFFPELWLIFLWIVSWNLWLPQYRLITTALIIHSDENDIYWAIFTVTFIVVPAVVNMLLGMYLLFRKMNDEREVFYWNGEPHRGWLIVG